MFAMCAMYTFVANASKIVGLAQVRNEADIIEQFLRGMAVYTDAIVILDDNSQDDTVSIVESLANELNIECIIKQDFSAWQKGYEKNNRQRLLNAGREIGGTHFILLDADEMFTAQCAKDNWLRNKILSLKPGQIMRFPMINLWDSCKQYRDDALCSPHSAKWGSIMAIICDDGQCHYQVNPSSSPSGVIHVSREPYNRIKSHQDVRVENLDHCVIHFKCVNLKNLDVKRVWYMCLEYIRAQEKTRNPAANAQKINQLYNGNVFAGIMPQNKQVTLKHVPDSWLAYDFFDEDSFARSHEYRIKDIMHWFEKYDKDYFKPLQFWNSWTMQELNV